jgi:hypothetical protein
VEAAGAASSTAGASWVAERASTRANIPTSMLKAQAIQSVRSAPNTSSRTKVDSAAPVTAPSVFRP